MKQFQSYNDLGEIKEVKRAQSACARLILLFYALLYRNQREQRFRLL